MLFEETDLLYSLPRQKIGRRVLDGGVEGRPDCWVVVAREEKDLEDWFRSEEQAVEVVPLRMCTAVLDNGNLILDDSDSDGSELVDWPELT